MNTCKVCYRPGSILKDTAGCDGCKGLTKKRCEICEESKEDAPPCASCYPERNFRWTALKAYATGVVPGRFERNESCRDCHSFLCGCGTSDYEEDIFEYLEQVDPGWGRPATVGAEADSPFEMDTKALTLSQIAEAEWRASHFGPHPLRNELPHQHVIKGVSFCNTCWQTLASTASGCYCMDFTECSCDRDTGTTRNTDPCSTCWPDGALRKVAAMDFLAAP
jgi:hypothetical protein